MSRFGTGVECVHLFQNSFLQMALSVTNKNHVNKIVEQIQQRCVGLRITSKDFQFFPNNKTPDAVKIPNEITDLHTATKWMKENVGLDQSRALGSVGANDHLVVLNLCHNMADGRFMASLAEELSQEFVPNVKQINGTPIDPSVYFAKEVEANQKEIKMCPNDPDIARFVSKVENPQQPKYVQSLWYRFPMKDLVCFDSTTKKANKMLEHQLVAASLAVASLNSDKEYYYFGCSCPVDTRRFKPSVKYFEDDVPKTEQEYITRKYLFGNFVSSVSAFTKANASEKLKDIIPRLRKTMIDKIKQGEQFKFLHTMQKVVEAGGIQGEFPDGSGIEVSSIGNIKIGGRINDYLFSHIVNGEVAAKTIEFVTYSLETPKNYEFSGYFNYMPGDATNDEAEKLVRSFEFSLKNINLDEKVRDAIELIRKNVL